MKLENQDFKAKAQETTGIFGKMKDSLNKIPGVNLGKTASELAAINKQASMTDLATLNNSVNTIADRFSVLGIIGVTALQNITNKAIDTGERMVKALTIDGAKTGFTEYELKIKSIQTMLTNTAKDGTTLEDINRELDTLNEYADKTIYNFADMTKNIGLFTTAGVKLDTSVTAIKGLSNWAAASGASAEDASRGMYQLSQALSSGVVRLQDWKSLENANMGGAIFRDALLDQAKAFGKNIDMSEGFNLSLQQGWLTTDVLMKVLDDFSKRDDFLEAATKVRTFTQLIDTAKESIGSGWAQTWEIVVCDFDEATKLWSSVSDVIGGVIQKSTDARNNTLKAFKDAGGLFISYLTNPTTGGVSASFASLGDIIIAEPGALICFAGPRVIEQTIGQKLPEGFQHSEFLLEHGMIDMIVDRKDMKQTLSKILKMHVNTGGEA